MGQCQFSRHIAVTEDCSDVNHRGVEAASPALASQAAHEHVGCGVGGLAGISRNSSHRGEEDKEVKLGFSEDLFQVHGSFDFGAHDLAYALHIKIQEHGIVQDHGALGDTSNRRHCLAYLAVRSMDRSAVAHITKKCQLGMLCNATTNLKSTKSQHT